MSHTFLNPTHLKILAVTTGALFLAGCTATMPGHDSASAPSSGNWAVMINEQIEFKPETTRTFLQDGKVVVGDFNHYKPNCNLEIRKRDDNNWQSVLPGNYQITRIQDTLEKVVRFNPGKESRLASIATGDMQLAFDDSGQSDIYLGMHFYLQGEDSNLMRLSCRGALAPPHEAEQPTLEEIEYALGDLMMLSSKSVYE